MQIKAKVAGSTLDPLRCKSPVVNDTSPELPESVPSSDPTPTTSTPTPKLTKVTQPSAMGEARDSSTHQKLLILHQELLDRLKRPQPIAERDEWLRTAFHGMDGPLFRKCQVELTNVVHRYQEMQEQQSRTAQSGIVGARSTEATSSLWPHQAVNPGPVWGSQDTVWVNQMSSSQPSQSQDHQAHGMRSSSSAPTPVPPSDSLPSFNISGLSMSMLSGGAQQILDLDTQQVVRRDLDTPSPSVQSRDA